MSKWFQHRTQQQKTMHQQAKLVVPPAPPMAPPKPPPAPPVGSMPNVPPPKPPASWLSRMQNLSDKPLSTLEEETARILSLPFIPPGTPRCPDRETYGKSLLAPNTEDPDFKLRDLQIDAIWEYVRMGGVLAPLGVGTGKTIITLMCACLAITERKHRRVCLMVPTQVLGQLMQTDIPHARTVLDMKGVEIYPVTGSARNRMALCKKSGRGIWLYTYSSLSTAPGFDELLAINATVYILDEAHNVANAKSARTKRLRSVWADIYEIGFKTVNELMGGSINRIEVIPLSGTLTKKSISDYAHLSAAALGLSSPTPVREVAIQSFSAALDSGNFVTLSNPEEKVMKQLICWAEEMDLDFEKPTRREDESDLHYEERCKIPLTLKEKVRFAYRERLNGSPGVIASTDQGVDASLLIKWAEPRPNTEDEDIMVTLMQRVVNDQLTPNGDVIEYAIHNFKWLWEISNGFYNSLEWPDIDHIKNDYMRQWGKTISDDEAEALLEAALSHHNALQRYHKALRSFLDYDHIPGCDTPMLVAGEMTRQIDGHPPNQTIPGKLLERYIEQKALNHEDLPKRIKNPVWLSDYKIKDVVAWAKKEKAGLIWFHHPIVGNRISELLKQASIEHTFAPAGENEKAFAEGIVVVSYSHGTGKNLQKQHKNLFAELRREAAINEQTIGRTHRSGQKADEVEVTMFIANYFDLAMFNGTLKDADYAQSTMGQPQRLCYASYNPVMPPTNARLMQRLGIITHNATSSIGAPWAQITPADLKAAADFFRPLIYGSSVKSSS